MNQTIGVAAWKYGSGRVASFTKAINYENISSNESDSLFVRFFLNTCLWATRNHEYYYNALRTAAIIKTGYATFDNRLQTLLSNLGVFSSVILVNPWYLEETDTSTVYSLYVLIPSYSALDGTKMPDTRQSRIITRVRDQGAGLVIGEWFHLLQSIPSKRSFSYVGNADDGLFKISPLKIEKDLLVFSKSSELLFKELTYDESISSTLPKTFTLSNVALDTPFNGHIVQMDEANEEATVYWATDLTSAGTTTTTTTTTTAIPATEEIKMKIGKLNLVNSCGPQKLFLDGPYKNYFVLEGDDLYLTKYIENEQKILLNVRAEDYFVHKRFNDIVETLEIDFVNCFAPISRPKNGAGPAFSFRSNGPIKSTWGTFAPTGVIVPFEDYIFIGEGKIDNPAISALGGTHGDYNALWMQVNNGGVITYNLTASMEQLNYYYYGGTTGDLGVLLLVQNSKTSNINPAQHTEDILGLYPNIVTVLNSVSGNETKTGTVNIPDPNALDQNDQRIRGDIFLILYLRKDIIRSERDDRVYATMYFGSTTTTPPPLFDFNVILQNNVPQSSIDKQSLKFTNKAQNNINLQQTFFLTPNGGLVLSGITAIDNSDNITVAVNDWYLNTNVKIVTVTLTSMPAGGGLATVTLNGSTNTTTTTPPPVLYNVVVNMLNEVSNVTLNNQDFTDAATFNDTSSYTISQQSGTVYTMNFNYSTFSGYEYRDANKPTAIIQSQNPAGMVTTVTVNRTSNLNGTISVPITVPTNGGTIELVLSPPNPVATTTTTTTTTVPPCDNTIYIICEQVLDCIEDNSGNCVPSLSSYQQIVISTCCELSTEEAMDIIRDYNGASSTATLIDMYGSECTTNNFEPFAPCLPKDSNGDCQQTLHNQIIDVISCGSSFNPLP